MRRKKIEGILCLTGMLLLTGCGTKAYDLTEAEESQIVNYAVHVVSKHNSYQKDGLVYVDQSVEETEPEEEPEVTAPSDDTVQAASEEPEEAVEDGSTDTGNPSEEPQQPEENTVQYDPENGEDSQEDQEETPDTDDDRNQEGAEVPEEETPTPAPEENKYPSVATDLTDGETVSASYRTFYVQAWDYQGNVLPSSSVEVLGNGLCRIKRW
mgnify:CR=1 FL=1